MNPADVGEPGFDASPFDALVLVSFGGPEGPDEVIPFLERVTAGRGIPPERLAVVGEHYFTLGGVSPINAQNRSLLGALRDALDERGVALPLVLGNRNSAPFLANVLRDLHADGCRRVLAVATSAYASYSGCRQYREDIAAALGDIDADVDTPAGMTVLKMRHYGDADGFVAPFAAGLADALDRIAAEGVGADETTVVFTTHSVPHAMALGSGPLAAHAPVDESVYVREHLDVIERTLAHVRAARADAGNDDALPAWTLAYQSRSGPPQVPWLEPDVNDVIAGLAEQGVRAVVVVPIGFVSDHMEVVWDLDHEARATAEGLGLRFERVPTPGTDPAFVAALADRIVHTLTTGRSDDRNDASGEPGWCGGGCCERAAGGSGRPGADAPDRPVVAGI